MRIISKAALASFAEQHSESKEPLAHWYGVAKHAAWQNLAEVRRDFPHADPVGVLTVFNIGGRKYRLIAAIKYRWQIIYIRHILTHAEYSQEKWKS